MKFSIFSPAPFYPQPNYLSQDLCPIRWRSGRGHSNHCTLRKRDKALRCKFVLGLDHLLEKHQGMFPVFLMPLACVLPTRVKHQTIRGTASFPLVFEWEEVPTQGGEEKPILTKISAADGIESRGAVLEAVGLQGPAWRLRENLTAGEDGEKTVNGLFTWVVTLPSHPLPTWLCTSSFPRHPELS